MIYGTAGIHGTTVIYGTATHPSCCPHGLAQSCIPWICLSVCLSAHPSKDKPTPLWETLRRERGSD